MPHCPTCDKPTNPFSELDPAQGMLLLCGNEGCRARLPAEQPAPRRAPVAAAPGLALVAVAQAQPANMAPAVQPQAVQQAATSSEPIGANDIKALARTRLAHVDGEIARLATLRVEQGVLRRMLGIEEPN